MPEERQLILIRNHSTYQIRQVEQCGVEAKAALAPLRLYKYNMPMPDLLQTLKGNDLGFYTIIAEAWGIELDEPDARSALPALVLQLSNAALFNEMLSLLPAEALTALKLLAENEGRLQWAVFCRRFGELRAYGAGRRDRERPDLHPVSTTEILWYRALLGKAFMDYPPEPQEFAFLPAEFLAFLQPLSLSPSSPMGGPSAPDQCAHALPADDSVVDHACTLLAGLRLGLDLAAMGSSQWNTPPQFLLAVLRAADLLDQNNLPVPEAARAFLEGSRGQALAALYQAWLNSQAINDLHYLPGLEFEGVWQNYPLQTRQKVIAWLEQVPRASWWSLPAFIQDIKEREPDFQRPGGDYDSWFIRQAGESTFLRGFSSWQAVDGALVRYLICGPLHWLGVVDLCAQAAGSEPAGFRLSAWADALRQNQPPVLAVERAQVRLGSAGQVRVPRLTPRSVRYQLARFCQWVSVSEQEYVYQLTPASLEHGRVQGLTTSHLTALLRRHGATPLPPTLLQALERWEKFGTQASVGPACLLRVTAPEMLTALRKTRASRFLGEQISPTVVVVRPGGEEAVLAALAEAGYLAAAKLDV